jgi:hypothetical protein
MLCSSPLVATKRNSSSLRLDVLVQLHSVHCCQLLRCDSSTHNTSHKHGIFLTTEKTQQLLPFRIVPRPSAVTGLTVTGAVVTGFTVTAVAVTGRFGVTEVLKQSSFNAVSEFRPVTCKGVAAASAKSPTKRVTCTLFLVMYCTVYVCIDSSNSMHEFQYSSPVNACATKYEYRRLWCIHSILLCTHSAVCPIT